jgi:CxxC-x17-CxxC domain-containing protein
MKKKSQNELDVFALITRVQEHLVALDKKVDALISRCLPQTPGAGPSPKPLFQPSVHPQTRPSDRHPARPMYQITCADCKKDSEIPFKPSGDRPVYCKECFARRKAANNVKAVPDSRPAVISPSQTVITPTGTIQAPAAKAKRGPATARKPAPRKKPAVRKKK